MHLDTICVCYLCHTLLNIMFIHLIDHFASLACYVYFILCSILFLMCCLLFEFHFSFMLYPMCILSLFISWFLSLLLGVFVYSWQKWREYCHFYMTLMHILKRKNSTFVHMRRRRNSIREMHKPMGRRHPIIRKPCFVLFYIMFVSLFSLWCFKLLLVSILCCSHRIVFVCWTCIHLYAITFYWLHVQMIICFAKWSL